MNTSSALFTTLVHDCKVQGGFGDQCIRIGTHVTYSKYMSGLGKNGELGHVCVFFDTERQDSMHILNRTTVYSV